MQISAEGNGARAPDSGVGQYPHFPVSSGGTRRIDGGEDIHEDKKQPSGGEILVEVLKLTSDCEAGETDKPA